MHQSESDQRPHAEPGRATWGPWLFIGVFLLVLGFFYWLLIYSGGAGTPAG